MTIPMVKPALILTLAGSLAACTGAGFDDNKNALGGAALGTMTGAILGGAIASDKDRGQRLGAVLGGAAGLALGARLDEQERALKSQLGGSGAVITNTGNELIVTLPEAITFDVDSATVKSRFMGPLSQLAANLNQYPNSRISVVGHTDDTGSVQHNQRLSESRAAAVATVLIQNGVNAGRISARGDGEFSPVASNGSAAGRAANRRVVVTITPTG